MEEIQTIETTLRESRALIRAMVAAKVIMAMFLFSLHLQQVTNLKLKCSAIGLTSLSFYVLFTVQKHRKNSEEHLSLNFSLIILLVTLILDPPYISCLYLVFSVLLLGPILVRKFDKYKLGTDEDGEITQAQLLVICFIYGLLILLKYEQIVSLEWNVIFFLLPIVAIIWLLLLALWLFLYLVSHSQLYDQDETDESYQQRLKKDNFYVAFVVLTYLSFLCSFGSVYIEFTTFNSLLQLTQLCTVIEITTYLLSSDKLIIYINPDIFNDRVKLHIARRLLYKDQFVQRTIYFKPQSGLQLCLYCDHEAAIVHNSCSYLLFCEECFAAQTCHTCVICKQPYLNNHSRVISRRAIDQLGEGLLLSKLLSEHEYLVLYN